MSLLHDADRALADEDYETAVKLYSEHLTASPEDAAAFASRAGAQLKLGRNREALQDANNAIKFTGDYEVAYYRKGLAAFGLSEYETAKQAFEKGLGLLEASGKPDVSRKYRTWIRKCDAEIEDEEVAVPSASASAAPPSTSSTPAVAGPSGSGGAQAAAPSAKPAPSAPPAPPTSSVKYQYYQNASHVIMTILQKNLKPEDTQIDIEPRKLKVVVKKDGADVVVFDKPLYDEVVVEECGPKFFATKVEIKLKKAQPYHWGDLEGSAATAAAPLPTSKPAAVPATKAEMPKPYAGRKNWDQVEKEIEKELDDQPQGEEALQKLFKDIYAKASDETRRAMVKSFQTSGGTVLSTNWDEVSQKDYEKERQAPDGMEWRTYEGDKVAQK